MADATCTGAALRPRSLFLARSAAAPALRSARPYGRPMAVPVARSSAVRSGWQLATIALCLLLGGAGLAGPTRLVGAARTALDGLAAQDALPIEPVDLADLPAMEPFLAQVLDPRPAQLALLDAQPRRATIQPFQYDVRPEDTPLDVARRFGVPLSALLWNNQLETSDQVRAGQRLTVLPVSGVLHRVQGGETAPEIADRYGARLEDVINANALEDPHNLAIGRVLVVPGGAVPPPTAAAYPLPAPTVFPLPLPTAVPPDRVVDPNAPFSPTAAPVTGRAFEAALIAAAMATPWDTLPRPAGGSAAQRDFILSLAAAVRVSQQLTGVPASVALAQAILESDWGRSRLARDAKNLFGIKAHSRAGTAGVYTAGTWEVLGGVSVIAREPFKAYQTVADSIVDHGHWFHDQPRYHGALELRGDPRAFARAIAEAGYATDPDYAAKLIALMDRFDLYAYDVE